MAAEVREALEAYVAQRRQEGGAAPLG
jgi:hypothetical protein